VTATLHLILTLPAVVALLSAWLIVWGWRGRRLDMHPVCQRCGFDLFGLPPGRRVCSECGHDLNRRRATRFGNRRRRWRAIVLGTTPLVLCLTWFAAVTWVVGRDVNVSQFKPVWWLARELDGTDSKSVTIAMAYAELRDRMRSGAVSKEQVSALVDRGLAVQSDASRTWTGVWGQFIEFANDMGLVTPERWGRYVRQAIESSVEVSARPRVRRGDRLPASIVFKPARAGPGLSILYERTMEVAGTPALPGMMTRRGVRLAPGSPATDRLLAFPSAYAELPDGAQEMTIVIDPRVLRRGAFAPVQPLRFNATWELVSRDVQTVHVVEDAALRDAVQQSAHLVDVERTGDWLIIEARIGRAPPRLALAYELIVRAGGREWGGTFFTVDPGHSGWVYEQVQVTGLASDRVDVVLRPSPDAAAQTVDVHEILGGEIVLENVTARSPRRQ
jgi:hypothetical protein